MKAYSFRFESSLDPVPSLPCAGGDVDLLLVFGLRELTGDPRLLKTLKEGFPAAKIAGCSTAGEFFGGVFVQGGIVMMAVCLEESRVEVMHRSVGEGEDQEVVARGVAEELGELGSGDLKALLVLPEGLGVDCDALVAGLAAGFEETGKDVPVMWGGLAGDSMRFEHTHLLSDAGVHEDGVVFVAFYGDRLEVAGGVSAGWPMFDEVLKITEADANLVFQIDGKRATERYGEVIGCEGEEMIRRAPFHPVVQGGGHIARTAYSFDLEAGTILFAGAVESEVRVANILSPEAFFTGARQAVADGLIEEPGLMLWVSCAARRMALASAIEMESESVREEVDVEVPCVGFYGYGEIGYCVQTGRNELVNHSFASISIREVDG